MFGRLGRAVRNFWYRGGYSESDYSVGYRNGSDRESAPQIYISDYTAGAVPALVACVNIVSSILARTPKYVVRENAKDTKLSHPVASLMARPSPLYSPKEFWLIAMSEMLKRGNSVMAIDRTREGVPFRLQHAEVQDIRMQGGRLRYQLRLEEPNGPIGNFRQAELDYMNVLHFKWYSGDKWTRWSDSPVRHQARAALGKMLAMDRHISSTLARGGAAGFILESQAIGGPSPTQIDKLESKIQERYSGYDNAGKAVALPPGVKAVKLGFSAVDLELIEMLKWGVREIASIYGVGLFMLQADDQKAGLQSSELPDRWKNSLRIGIEPHIANIQSELDFKLFRPGQQSGMNPLMTVWDTTWLELGTMGEMAIALKDLVQGAAIVTPNEARKYINKPAIEGGDELRSPTGAPMQNGNGEGGDDPIEALAQALTLENGDLDRLLNLLVAARE